MLLDLTQTIAMVITKLAAIALSNGGANYAWDIGAGKFPVPACTPFSPEILRTAIDKVRNNEDPVPIN